MLSLGPLVFILVASFHLSSSKLTKVTVDDQIPDTLTGAQLVYTPDSQWQYNGNCTGCPSVLDPSQANRGTWKSNFYRVNANLHKTHPPPRASISFIGNAVSVHCILPFFNNDGVQSHMTFFLDEQRVYEFKPEAIEGNDYAYDIPVYINNSMTMGNHTLSIQNGFSDGKKYLMILDYITFSTDVKYIQSTVVDKQSGSASSLGTDSSKVKALTGALVTVCILFTIILAYLLYRLHATRKRRLDSPSRINTKRWHTSTPKTEQPSVWGWLTRYLGFNTSKRSVSFNRSLFVVGRPRPRGENVKDFVPIGMTVGGRPQPWPALSEELPETQSKSRWAFVMSWRDRTIREAQIPTLPPTSHAPTTLFSEPNPTLQPVQHGRLRSQRPQDAPKTTRPQTRRFFTIVNA